jgi:hypothetical protein
MKTKILIGVLTAFLITVCSYNNCFSQSNQYDEAAVRYKIADMQLGDVYGFYKKQENNDPNTKEAVKRWKNGIRISNIDDFERKIMGERGWLVVNKGTNITASGLDMKLSNEKKRNQYDEAAVRYKIADMQLGNVYGFYKSQQNNDPNTKEAVVRWEKGVRVRNINDFERKIVGDKGWLVVHKGTNTTVNGLDVELTTD